MNKNKWNSLPKDIQQIIEKINEEYIEKQGKLWDELDKEALDFFTQKKGKVITLSKEEDARWQKLLQPILEEYVKNMKAKGLPGEEKPAYEYDTDSRLTKGAATSYQYGGGNNPIKIGTGSYVYDKADEIELVDTTADDLLQRLREGKVYVKAQAERALKHFFSPGNLTALRELALRKTAQRVDRDMTDYLRAHAIAGPWPAGERILVRGLAILRQHPGDLTGALLQALGAE